MYETIRILWCVKKPNEETYIFGGDSIAGYVWFESNEKIFDVSNTLYEIEFDNYAHSITTESYWLTNVRKVGEAKNV